MMKHATRTTQPQAIVPARLARGFTLIELMVVIAIVGILAAIAYPSYTESVAKGRRADALKTLQEAQQYMQRLYVANNTYEKAGGGNPILPAGLATVTQNSGGATTYAVTVDVASQTGYTLKATRDSNGVMAHDPCGDFKLTSTGARSLDNATKPLSYCWK